MARELKYSVPVLDEDGRTVWFKPGQELPAWARKQITNPKAWAGADEPDEAADGGSPEPFDPTEHKVEEIQDYLAGLTGEGADTEIDRVLAAEAAGRGRTTVKDPRVS